MFSADNRNALRQQLERLYGIPGLNPQLVKAGFNWSPSTGPAILIVLWYFHGYICRYVLPVVKHFISYRHVLNVIKDSQYLV